MTIDNFIPLVWASSLLRNLNNNHVFANAFNRDYEGEIKEAGDSVRITSVGRVTINTHTPNADMSAPQILQDSGQTLVIDQAKDYHFYVDDMDKRQAKTAWREGVMAEAGWGLADATDTFLATTLAAGLTSANTLSAATIGTGPTDSDAYTTIVDLGVLLDDNNVPPDGRCVFIPNWFEGMLRKDPRFTSFGTADNVARLRGSAIGQVDSFMVYKSNNMPTSGGQPDRARDLQGRGHVRRADQQGRGVPPAASLRRRAEGPAPLRREGHPPERHRRHRRHEGHVVGAD